MSQDNRHNSLMSGIPGRVAELERRLRGNAADINKYYGDYGKIVIWNTLGKIMLFQQSRNTVVQYPKQEYDTIVAGDLDNALGDAVSGDIIEIPAVTISSAHTMVAGVKVVGRSRYATILSGQITGAADASIENLSIIQSVNSADNIVGVDSPASGTFYINDCDIEVTQAGAGNAYGLSVDVAGTTIECWNSYLYGSSGSGSGYGAYHSNGNCYIYGGRAYGSTATFNV